MKTQALLDQAGAAQLMGAGASVLQGTPLYRAIQGGIHGYNRDFPPGHWVWDNATTPTDQASTEEPDEETPQLTSDEELQEANQ